MLYKVHGKSLIHDGHECGIYKSQLQGFTMDYAVMDINLLIERINTMQEDEAIKAVTALRDMASEQVNWKTTPQNQGFPILRQIPEPTPIDEIRENIENTKRLSDDILKVFQGE